MVPLPGRSTFYKLIDVLATGRHTFGSAVTRRQTANRPQGMFTSQWNIRLGAVNFCGVDAVAEVPSISVLTAPPRRR
jgi:hypothetical protein